MPVQLVVTGVCPSADYRLVERATTPTSATSPGEPVKYDDVTSNELRPSRRTVTRAAAWSVPVVAAATAVPAYAASCTPVTVTATNATSATRVSNLEWRATFDADGNGPLPGNVLTVKAAYTAGMAVRDDGPNGTNDNFTIQNPVGGLNTYGLVLAQRLNNGANTGAIGRYTFTFSKPVTGLTFTLTDIDSTTGDFWDAVWLTSGFTSSNRSAGMTGDGTQGNPFRQSNGNTAVNNASGNNGNVTISYPGTISTFTLSYSNRVTGQLTADPDQVVTIANFSFAFQPC